MLWYLSQPIAPKGAETLESNVEVGLRWYRFLLIHKLDVVAPYFGLLKCLDEFNPTERKLGMHIDNCVKERSDGVVTVGTRKRSELSTGVREDISDFVRTNRMHLDLRDMAEDEVAVFLSRLPVKMLRK